MVIQRWLLEKHFGGDKRMIAEFEALGNSVDETSATVASNLEATDALQDATVIVLSANAAFNNERILKLDPGLEALVDDTFVTIRLKDVARTIDFPVVLVATTDVQLNVPASGTVVTFEGLAGLGNYANDAAAATGGVAVGSMYRNGSVLMVRVT